MKTIKLILMGYLLIGSMSIFAQNNSVGIGTLTPDNSAILELESVNQGFLMTRLNTSQINSITIPAEGVIIYNTDDQCYWFQDNVNWKRICNTDSLLTLINNLGDTIGYIYDSLAIHNTNITNNTTNIANNTTLINSYGDTINYIYDSLAVHNTTINNLTTIINNHSDSLAWIYDSLGVHATNIYNNTTLINSYGDTINFIYDSLVIYNTLITNNATNISNLTTIINNHSDSLGWIYDSLAVHNTNIFNNTTNIINNTTNIQNLSDSLGWVYDSLLVHNTNIFNLFDSISIINNHLGVIDSTLLEKWDLWGNSGTSAAVNFLGTTDNVDLVFRTNNIEKTRLLVNGNFGLGTNTPTQRLDINANALRLRLGATNNYVLTTNATGVGTWQNPALNPLISSLGGDWKILGNSNTVSGTNFLGTTNNQALDFRTNNILKVRVSTRGHIEIFNTGNSVFIGDRAGTNDDLSGNLNVFVGYQAGNANTTAGGNTAVGYNALRLSNGLSNTAVGGEALGRNTSGIESSAFGLGASQANTTGWGNASFGVNSQWANTTGTNNVSMGWRSLQSNTTGTNNVAIGNMASSPQTAFSWTVSIGASSTPTASGQARIGSGATTSIGGAANWTNFSDKRFKTNVKENVIGLDFILRLTPVTYNLDVNAISEFLKIPKEGRSKEMEEIKTKEIQIGFLAQDVEKVAKELNFNFHGVDAPDNSGDHYGLRYAEFVPPIVKAIQEQQKEIELLKKQNEELRKLIEQLIAE